MPQLVIYGTCNEIHVYHYQPPFCRDEMFLRRISLVFLFDRWDSIQKECLTLEYISSEEHAWMSEKIDCALQPLSLNRHFISKRCFITNSLGFLDKSRIPGNINYITQHNTLIWISILRELQSSNKYSTTLNEESTNNSCHIQLQRHYLCMYNLHPLHIYETSHFWSLQPSRLYRNIKYFKCNYWRSIQKYVCKLFNWIRCLIFIF